MRRAKLMYKLRKAMCRVLGHVPVGDEWTSRDHSVRILSTWCDRCGRYIGMKEVPLGV